MTPTRHWHFVLISAVCEILEKIFGEQKYADKAIEYSFKNNKKWGKRDRQFVAETVYDIVRHYRFLSMCAANIKASGNPYLTIWALYEVWKFDVDPTELLRAKTPLKLDIHELRKVVSQKPQDPAVALSYPDWLYELFLKNFSGDADALLQALNEPAPVCLRANTLKVTRDQLRSALKEEGVETQELRFAPDGLVLPERRNVFISESFKKGFFEVQDEASQRVAPLLDPQPGERIADACAGAGGKTLHLAALMKNKGQLMASDVIDWKLQQLKLRARRGGVSNLKIQTVENSKDIKKHKDKFDRVLIDAPCSGTGVIRRNPDTKWKLTPQEMDRLLGLQRDILNSYSGWVKPGGVLVYATCSVLAQENQEQVDAFVKAHPEFKKVGEPIITRPDVDGMDGFFAQKFVRE